MQYVFHEKDTEKLQKHGIDLTVFNEDFPPINIVRVHCDEGHFQEFYNKRSAFAYSVIDGIGTFVLNDEKFVVAKGDLIIAPAGTRIHYFGKLDMILSVAPAFDPRDEVHVRFVEKAESPYHQENT